MGLLRKHKIMWTFHYENKSEKKAPLLLGDLPYWEVLHYCKVERLEEIKLKKQDHMFWWLKDSSDLWLCLLWCLQGICDSQARREAGKALRKSHFLIKKKKTTTNMFFAFIPFFKPYLPVWGFIQCDHIHKCVLREWMI